jgi:hypothetical protein
MATELGQFIQEEHAIVGQRHLAGHRDVAAADHPCIRDRMVGRATRAGGDSGGAVAGAASDAVDACGLNGFRQRHRQQDGDRWERPRTLSDLKRFSHIDAAKLPATVSLPMS